MPRSADELIALIDEQAARMLGGNAVSAVRRRALLRLRDVLQEEGLPMDPDRRRQLSLVPLVFQEANYDDIDWTDRLAPLGRLSGILAIDLAVQSDGRARHELTDAEYGEYVRASMSAIRSR